MKTYRIVDLRYPEPLELNAQGPTPELAASEALGISVVRSGAKKDLIAKAYWHHPDQPMNMVRLYRRIGEMPVAEEST